MERYFSLLQEMPLFNNIAKDELENLLKCMNVKIVNYPKGGFVFFAGNAPSRVGIVCEGSVQVVREDFSGNRAILAKFGAGNIFGEVFACAYVDVLPINVEACEDCTILLMDYRKIITICGSACTFHSKLIENMLGIIANKNLMLNKKIEVLSARSTRDKIMTYLTIQAVQKGNRNICIPFNRQELADYLAVERSAMSAELGRMREEGLIHFHKNEFELLYADNVQ